MKSNSGAMSLFLGLLSLVAASIGSGPSVVRAQTSYPTKTIYMICSSAAGGTSDLISRALAEPLSEQLHQSVIVDNVPGANGTIAAERVARARPDGYALFSAVDANLVVNPFLYRVTYDPLRDYVPISLMVRVRLALLVPPSGPNSIQELIAKAKANPGKLNYGSVGFGSAHHLGTEQFKILTHTDIVHVPFKGAAAANTALVGGQIDMAFASIGQAKPLMDAGKVKVLAVAAPRRSPMLPGVPTMDEAGVPGFELSSWYALLAPEKTPPDIVERLTRETKAALADPRFVKRMQSQGLEIIGSSSAEMMEVMRADTKKWRHMIDVTGTKVVQ